MKMIMGESKRKKPGAGFIIFKEETLGLDEPLMLALVKHDGSLDIPKGSIEEKESKLSAAYRECYEECSIQIKEEDILFFGEKFAKESLTTFCAKTSEIPSIRKNPKTGKLEHAYAVWVGKKEFIGNCIEYLKPHAKYFYQLHKKNRVN